MDQELLISIVKDWPLLAVLLAILIGLYRIASRTIGVVEKHLEKLISALESIADEIQRKERHVRDRDSRTRSSSDSEAIQ